MNEGVKGEVDRTANEEEQSGEIWIVGFSFPTKRMRL